MDEQEVNVVGVPAVEAQPDVVGVPAVAEDLPVHTELAEAAPVDAVEAYVGHIVERRSFGRPEGEPMVVTHIEGA